MSEVNGGSNDSLEDHVAELLKMRLSWDYWRERHLASGRCLMGKMAGAWAIGVLESEYGNDWLKIVSEKCALPNEILWAPTHSADFVELIRHALILNESLRRSGYAQIRKATRTDLNSRRLSHSKIQFEICSLFVSVGGKVFFEHKSVGTRPVDVLIEIDDLTIRVEVFSIFPDSQFLAENEVMNQFSSLVMSLSSEFGVFPVGEVLDGYSNTNLKEFEVELRRAALKAKVSNLVTRVESEYFDLNLVPLNHSVGNLEWSIPGGTPIGWARTASRILQKALTARQSGQTWLRIDLLDTTWELSDWAEYSLYEKTRFLADATNRVLAGVEGIRGVVFSNGGLTTTNSSTGESTLTVNGARGMVRKLWPLRSRECIIVQIDPEAASEAELWWRIYDLESEWFTTALNKQGFPSPQDLIQPQGN